MSSNFSFSLFGITVVTSSKSSLFSKLLKNKFSIYNDIETQKILDHQVTISFKESVVTPVTDKTYLGDHVWKSENTVQILHYYLSSKTNIIAKKNTNDQLTDISIVFNSSATFNILNLLSLGKLKKQLFQNIIKLFIEQALLGYICITKNMSCVHAAAIEQDGKVTIFAGLNGVGKSSLALSLLKDKKTSLFADNYLLLKGATALLTPDAVRLKQDSLSKLHIKAGEAFGFGKFYISKQNWSSQQSAKIAKVYFVTRANEWKEGKEKNTAYIFNVQKIFKEEVTLSPLMILFEKEYRPQLIPFTPLQIGKWEDNPL